MTTEYVDLRSAADFILLATTTVTSTSTSVVIGGDIGVTGAGTIVGFPPATLTDGYNATVGTSEAANADLVTAYDEVTSRTSANLLSAEMGGQTLTPGLYHTTGAATIASNLTLDGTGNYVFRINAALSIAASVSITLLNGATSDAIFWQVSGAFSMGANAVFEGTVMGAAAIGLADGCVVNGRLMTKAGALTLANSDVTFEYSEVRLAAKAVKVKTEILASTLTTGSFSVEVPTGESVTVDYSFGDSCVAIVTGIVETTLLSQGNRLIWQLFYGEQGVDDDTLASFVASDPNFTLRPRTEWVGNWERVTNEAYAYTVSFKTATTSFDIPVDSRFCVRFYQREMQTWLGSTGPNQVWIDEADEFIVPAALVSTLPLGSTIRIVVLDETTFSETRLST